MRFLCIMRLELRRRPCGRHIALNRNPRKGTRGGRRRSDPEASPRMRQLIPTILCPNDFAAYPGYRQFRNRLLLVKSLCECHLGPAKSRCVPSGIPSCGEILSSSNASVRDFPDTRHTSAKRIEYLAKILCAAVGEFLSFDIAPESFHWIQIGSVTGQPLHVEPVALAIQEVRHHTALVRGEAISKIRMALAPWRCRLRSFRKLIRLSVL